MLTWIFQQIIISLVVIILIHSIYKFLQLNLTTPKVRDLVNKPTKQYEEIYNTFKNTKKDEQNNNSSMKSELQNYLKELSVNQETNIKSINEIMIIMIIMIIMKNFHNQWVNCSLEHLAIILAQHIKLCKQYKDFNRYIIYNEINQQRQKLYYKIISKYQTFLC